MKTIDASVWIAATGSSTGASALVLALCQHGYAKVVSSRLVLLESERNIREKLGEHALLRFYQEIADLDLDLVETPTSQEIATQSHIIDPKDAHVLAAGLKGKVKVLLPLDRMHFLIPSVLDAGLQFSIMTPGDFLRGFLSSEER